MRQNTFAAKLKGHATEVYLDGTDCCSLDCESGESVG